MSSALEGDEWSAARSGRTLPPGKTRYPFYKRLVGPRAGLDRRKISLLQGLDPRTVQSVTSRYIDCATRPRWLRVDYMIKNVLQLSRFTDWATRPTNAEY